MGKAHPEKKQPSCKHIFQSFTIGPEELILSARYIEIRGRIFPELQESTCLAQAVQPELGIFFNLTISCCDSIPIQRDKRGRPERGQDRRQGGGAGLWLCISCGSCTFKSTSLKPNPSTPRTIPPYFHHILSLRSLLVQERINAGVALPPHIRALQLFKGNGSPYTRFRKRYCSLEHHFFPRGEGGQGDPFLTDLPTFPTPFVRHSSTPPAMPIPVAVVLSSHHPIVPRRGTERWLRAGAVEREGEGVRHTSYLTFSHI